MNVVKLVPYPNKDTVSVLRCLLAEAVDGHIVSVAACFQTRGGFEDSAFTGRYKARPAEAANAVMRLAWKITKAQDLE